MLWGCWEILPGEVSAMCTNLGDKRGTGSQEEGNQQDVTLFTHSSICSRSKRLLRLLGVGAVLGTEDRETWAASYGVEIIHRTRGSWGALGGSFI